MNSEIKSWMKMRAGTNGLMRIEVKNPLFDNVFRIVVLDESKTRELMRQVSGGFDNTANRNF
jgi:hypothetical protein